METKRCNTCLEEKTKDSFYNSKKHSDNLIPKCKLCSKNKLKILKTTTVKEGFKVCKKCGVKQEIINFYPCDDCFDKYQNTCRLCHNITKKIYRKNNIENLKNCQKNWREANKEHKKQKAKEWYLKNRDKILDKAKKYYEENKTEIKEYKKEWDILNKDYINEKERQRKLENPMFKLTHNIRNLIHQSFKRACNNTYKKSDKSEKILGCTIPEFIEHLQSLFTERMTLENHGNCEECWQIDHKIPISSAKTEGEIYKLNHYTNLQPLWRSDNLSKGKKYEQIRKN